jgi:hypothetical protein
MNKRDVEKRIQPFRGITSPQLAGVLRLLGAGDTNDIMFAARVLLRRPTRRAFRKGK